MTRLERHAPLVRYDSGEQFFATDVGALVEDRDAGLRLRRIATGIRMVESGTLELSGLQLAEFRFDPINGAFAAAHERPDGLARAVVRMA